MLVRVPQLRDPFLFNCCIIYYIVIKGGTYGARILLD